MKLTKLLWILREYIQLVNHGNILLHQAGIGVPRIVQNPLDTLRKFRMVDDGLNGLNFFLSDVQQRHEVVLVER